MGMFFAGSMALLLSFMGFILGDCAIPGLPFRGAAVFLGWVLGSCTVLIPWHRVSFGWFRSRSFARLVWAIGSALAVLLRLSCIAFLLSASLAGSLIASGHDPTAAAYLATAIVLPAVIGLSFAFHAWASVMRECAEVSADTAFLERRAEKCAD